MPSAIVECSSGEKNNASAASSISAKDANIEMKEYLLYLTNRSDLFVTLGYTGVVFVLIILKSLFNERVPDFIIFSRILAVISISGYIYTLYRVKYGKRISISLHLWGNFVVLQRTIAGGLWIYHTMRTRDCPEISSDAMLEFVISMAANVVFSVHSPWSPFVVFITEIIAICLGAMNSPLSIFIQVFILCCLIGCLTYYIEMNHFKAFKSHRYKEQLLLQLEKKNAEMRALIGNVAHDLKVSKK